MDKFREDSEEKVSQLEFEMRNQFGNEIKQQFSHNYFEENPERKWFHFETEIMEKIGRKIIEKYCSNFTQNVQKFLSIVEEVKYDNIIKKVKIGLAIGGGIVAVGGLIAASVAFPLAPLAAAGVITVLGADAAAIPFFAGIAAFGAGGAGAGISALLSIKKKKKFSFYLIPPENFMKGNIKFELFIGQVIYPLNIPDN